MQCNQYVTHVGRGVRGRWQAGDNRCRQKATGTHNGIAYCTRHRKLLERDDRIQAYIHQHNLHCPDHPRRQLRLGRRGQILFCSAWTGEAGYCRFELDLPPEVLKGVPTCTRPT